MTDKNLIFIVSQPRSGSTLLQALLSNNNHVATVSEPWLLLPFFTYNKPELGLAKYSSRLAYEGINDFKSKINKEKFDNDLSNFLLNQYEQIRTKNESYILDKTPRYYEILNEITYHFPNAKIIILKRNPFAVLSSIIKTWNQDSLQKLLFHKRDILVAPKLLHQFTIEQKKNRNVVSIQYEELLSNPEHHTKQLYKWLNLPYNAEILNYSNNLKFKGKMGDPTGIIANKIPNSSHIDLWKETYNEKKWKDFFNGYANFLGSDFLNAYGEYDQINERFSKKFDQFIKQSKWNFYESEIPLKRIIKYRIFSKLRLTKF
ncbi:sulfotransferase family protein [Carboxylicivirga sp. N1Y90]|uniref:sulfotransferase family protein n=1 Tax=Carboxylicivirga fragile TaxID=3417571 RepID=UPI003D334954|nr:sulfotransferase [Marinilabiliaceae bacterium N1Y90]